MPVNGPTNVTGEYNPSVASPQAKPTQTSPEAFLGALKTTPSSTWIDPRKAMRDTIGFGTLPEMKQRNENLAKARGLLSGQRQGDLLFSASAEPAFGMPNSRSSWPVQAVKDLFSSIQRVNEHIMAPFSETGDSPYDSMDELITDTTMLAGDFTGAGVASRIGKPAASNVLRAGIGGDPPIDKIKEVLTKSGGGSANALRGDNVYNIWKLKFENPELNGKQIAEQLGMTHNYVNEQIRYIQSALKRNKMDEFNIPSAPMGNRSKTMKSDEGIPPTDKITAPDKMYDPDLPMDRVGAEIKKLREFAKNTNLTEVTIEDMAQHVYGSIEPWAKKRINEALRAAEKQGPKAGDTIGVSPPPTPTKPIARPLDEVTAARTRKSAGNDNLTPLQQELADEEAVKGANDLLKDQLARDPFQENIDIFKDLINKEKKAERPDIMKIKHYGDRIKQLEQSKKDMDTQWAQDPPPFEGEPDMNLYGTPEFAASAQPLVDNYLGVVYTPEELPLAMARFKKEGLTTEKLFDVIDIFELEGIDGLRKMIEVYEKGGQGRTDAGMLRWAKDIVKRMESLE